MVHRDLLMKSSEAFKATNNIQSWLALAERIQAWSADSRVREFLASDAVRADKAVRDSLFAFVKSTLLAPFLLALFVWSGTPLTGESSEARYRVIKIIEGSGTSVPEAGGNQSERPGGRLD